MLTPNYELIRQSLNGLFNDLESLSVVNSYHSEHEAAQKFADWLDTHKHFYTDDLSGYGNHNIIPYAAGFILNYVRTVINKYEEEARLALTDGPRVQALVIKHGFAKVVKESMYANQGVTTIIQGYRDFYDDTYVSGCNDSISDRIRPDMDEDALMFIFAKNMPLDKEQAIIWLAHYLMLAPSCDKADEAVKKFNTEFVTDIPEVSPKRLLDFKSASIQEIVSKISEITNPVVKITSPIVETTTPNINTASVSDDSFLDIPTTKLEELPGEELTSEEIIARQSFENIGDASSIEDIALSFGVPIISGEDWKKSTYARTCPVLVKNFDFRHIKKTDLGRANYLLVGAEFKKDVRVEVKSQNVAGTAGDKLPVSLRRYKNWSATNVYGQTIVAVLGNLSLFSKEALEMAREEAVSANKSNPGKVRYVEGFDAFNNVLQAALKEVKEQFEPKSIATSTPVSHI